MTRFQAFLTIPALAAGVVTAVACVRIARQTQRIVEVQEQILILNEKRAGALPRAEDLPSWARPGNG
jgi:hypothetical protein